MALAQARIDLTEARIAGLELPHGTNWANEARHTALTRLRAMGLPAARDEYWKYTNPAELTVADAPEAALFDPGQDRRVFEDIDRLKIVFVDGVFDAAQSDDLSLEGLEISRL